MARMCGSWSPSCAPVGDVSGPSWAVLGASWAVLGPSWAVLGASWGPLGRLGAVFEASGAVLERRKIEKARMPNIFKHFRDICFFCLLGPSWECSWGSLGASWGPWAVFGPSWASWGDRSSIRGHL
eukprot:3856615-Pyramimonas_sp.AAC.1